MPTGDIDTELHELALRNFARLGKIQRLIGLTVLIGTISWFVLLGTAWYTDYASCKRNQPVRVGLDHAAAYFRGVAQRAQERSVADRHDPLKYALDRRAAAQARLIARQLQIPPVACLAPTPAVR